MNNIIKGLVFGVIFISVVIISMISTSVSQEYSLNKSAVVYQVDEPAHFVAGEENIDKIEQNNQEIKEQYPDQEISTTSNDVYTYSTISYTTEAVVTNTMENTYPLTNGYTVTIDGESSFYVTDISLLTEAINEIFATMIQDDLAYEKFITTGILTPKTINGKTYYDISIENKFEVEEGYVPGNKTFSTVEDVMFYLLHGDVAKEYEYISDNNSTDDIKVNNNINDLTLQLNNTGIDATTLLYDGAQIVTNTLDPVIDIAVYYETAKVETIPYNEITEETDTLDVGETEIHQNGKNGSQEVTYKTKMVNGKEVYTEPVDYFVIEQSVDEITYEGTNEPGVPSGGGSASGSGIPQGSFIWPLPSQNVICGWYCYPGHDGLDISAWYGAPIYAADGGTVIDTGYAYDMGNYVVIDHGNGYVTRYMHMSSTNVTQGQKVSQGQVIGYEGATGIVTGPHLHFEVYYNGATINPLEVLP